MVYLALNSLVLVLVSSAYASYDVCETLDGDCPSSCQDAGFAGSNNFNAHLQIAPFHPRIQAKAFEAERYIKGADNSIISTDSPIWKLHTTMYYFCCYTDDEEKAIKDALETMLWSSFEVEFDTTGCNVDMQTDDLVYLHAMPKDQSALFDFASRVENVIASVGGHVEPRETLYHMTLARVHKYYPVDDVINHFVGDEDFKYGKLTVSGFRIDNRYYKATIIKKEEDMVVSCPCDPALCQPLTTPLPTDETLAFTTLTSPASLNFTKLTTVALFGTDHDDLEVMDLICKAHESGVRVVRGVEFPMDDIESDTAISSWIDEQITISRTYGYDGLNWDNEQLSGTADVLNTRVRQAVDAFRGAFDAPSMSFDLNIYARGDGYDFATLASTLDFVVPMGYDICWSSEIAAANSPINLLTAGIDSYLEAGVGASKIVLGLPWYGWEFTCAPGTDDTSIDPCALASFEEDWLEVAKQVALDDILNQGSNATSEVVVDEESNTKMFTYVDEAESKVKQAWFDDVDTLGGADGKYGLVDKYGLKGVAIWTIDMLKPGEEVYDEMLHALP